jgi:hypothetical protein
MPSAWRLLVNGVTDCVPGLVEVSHVDVDSHSLGQIGDKFGDELLEVREVVNIDRIPFSAQGVRFGPRESKKNTYALLGATSALNENLFLDVILYFSSPCFARRAFRKSM